MSQAITILNSRRKLLFLSLLWVLLWAVPWGKLPAVQNNLYLAFLTDMIRLGIAIGLFIVPGALLYILLRSDSLTHDRTGIIPSGFALSVFMIGTLGLIGRLAGFPFSLVRNVFALIGFSELILAGFFRPDLTLFTKYLQEAFRSVVRNPPLLFALILATLMTFHDSLFFIDDTTYSAYLTNWQHSQHLGFNNIVHRANVIENIRFWLAMYPMSQALLSDLSGVPGLLLMGNYLGPILAPLAVVASYWFSRALGLSRKAAGFSVLIQVSFYVWMSGPQLPVGKWFYESLTEDKVAAVFFLAPVFFVMVLLFIQKPTGHNRFLVILTGFGITLTHPVMLFFSCSIAVLLALFAWMAKKSDLRRALEIFIICVVLMMPYAAIRLSDRTGEISGPYGGEQAKSTLEIDLYTNIISDVFYGLNPQVLMFVDIPAINDLHLAFQVFRAIPMVLVALGAGLALKRLKQGPLYWFVLSGSLLVFGAAFPYTGWILGYFVSARLISRASWFFPMGLATVLVFIAIIDWFKAKVTLDEKQAAMSEKRRLLWGLMILVIFVSPFLTFSLSQRLPLYVSRLGHNKQLAEMGAFIDQNSSDPTTVIALDYRDVQLLPAVSAHANLISFREELEYNGHNNFLSLDEIHARIYASNTIRSLDQTVSPEEKCSLIRKYGLRFILAQAKDVRRFMSTLTPCNSAFQVVLRTKELVLLELK